MYRSDGSVPFLSVLAVVPSVLRSLASDTGTVGFRVRLIMLQGPRCLSAVVTNGYGKQVIVF